MSSGFSESELSSSYEVNVHRVVQKFLKQHPDLREKWESIVDQVRNNPRLGRHIDHLKGPLHCSYRWDEGTYRIKYEVLDDSGEIYFYDATHGETLTGEEAGAPEGSKGDANGLTGWPKPWRVDVHRA